MHPKGFTEIKTLYKATPPILRPSMRTRKNSKVKTKPWSKRETYAQDSHPGWTGRPIDVSMMRIFIFIYLYMWWYTVHILYVHMISTRTFHPTQSETNLIIFKSGKSRMAAYSTLILGPFWQRKQNWFIFILKDRTAFHCQSLQRVHFGDSSIRINKSHNIKVKFLTGQDITAARLLLCHILCNVQFQDRAWCHFLVGGTSPGTAARSSSSRVRGHMSGDWR